MDDLIRDGRRVVALERLLAGEHPVGDGAQRELIGASVDGVGLAARLLGRHVRRRAQQIDGVRDLRGAERSFEMPKSSTLTSSSVWPSTVGQEDVRRLEIAVHDAVRVRERQRGRHRVDDAGDRRPAAAGRRCSRASRSRPCEVLHDEVGTRVGRDVEVEDLDDVGMAKLRHDLGFAAEARERVLVLRQLREQQLHRELPGQAGVLGQIDLAHRAAADAAADDIGVAQDDIRVPGGNRFKAQGVHYGTAEPARTPTRYSPRLHRNPQRNKTNDDRGFRKAARGGDSRAADPC